MPMESRLERRLAALVVMVLVAVSGLVLAFHHSGLGAEGSQPSGWPGGSPEGNVVVGGVKVSGDVEGYKQLLSAVEGLASLTPGPRLGLVGTRIGGSRA